MDPGLVQNFWGGSNSSSYTFHKYLNRKIRANSIDPDQKLQNEASDQVLYCLPLIQGPAVQSIISLTSLLRVISLTVLADSIYNIMIFFAGKMWVAFALQKLLTFFQQKIPAYLRITRCKF